MTEGLEKDIDFRPMFLRLTVDELLLAANFLLNRASIRDVGELGHHLGGRFEFSLTPKEPTDDK